MTRHTGIRAYGHREALGLRGRILLYSRPASPLPPEAGEWRLEHETPNLIVTAGKVLASRMLAEEAGYDTGLTYLEVGTGSTAALVTDVALQTTLRRAAVNTPVLRVSNVLQYRAFFTAAQVTALIKELGLFGHSTATATLGTGELFNRAIVTFDNTGGTKDLTVVVQVTVG